LIDWTHAEDRHATRHEFEAESSIRHVVWSLYSVGKPPTAKHIASDLIDDSLS
jgi:hypothetical protein